MKSIKSNDLRKVSMYLLGNIAKWVLEDFFASFVKRFSIYDRFFPFRIVAVHILNFVIKFKKQNYFFKKVFIVDYLFELEAFFYSFFKIQIKKGFFFREKLLIWSMLKKIKILNMIYPNKKGYSSIRFWLDL